MLSQLSVAAYTTCDILCPQDVYLSMARCSGQQKATLGQRQRKKGQDQKTMPRE